MKCPKCGSPISAGARFCGECGAQMTPSAGPVAEDKPMTGVFKEDQPLDIASLRTIDEESETKTSSTAPQKVMQPGEVFAGRYEIAALIGEGGMGVVYRAHDKLTEKDVALKLIRADRLAGKDAVKRLIREGVTSRDIRHSNVVAVYDVGESGGQPYMSMEFLNGRSLRAWNRARMQTGADCSMKTAAHIIGEILAGLEAAHKVGVVHRDLKPENVMLLSDPNDGGVQLKILDFGVARAAGAGDTGATSLGTRGYMAPEQITAPDAAQPSADLYSLSVMFYELLVGVVPQGHWQPPSGGRSDVPPTVDALIQKGLSNNPRVRPQNVAEYVRALQDAMRPTGIQTNWLTELENRRQEILHTITKDLNINVGGGGAKPPGAGGTQGGQGAATPNELRNYWQLFMYAFAKRYADGKGRAHRKEYWAFFLTTVVLTFAAGAVDVSLFGEYAVAYGQAPVTFITLLVLIAPSLALASRRAHDLGYNGWIGAVLAITFFGAIYLGMPRGNVGDNQYGPDPLAGQPAGAAA